MYIREMSSKYSLYVRKYLLCICTYTYTWNVRQIYICILYEYPLNIQRVAFAHTYDMQWTSFLYHYIYIGYVISADVYAMYVHCMSKCYLGIVSFCTIV